MTGKVELFLKSELKKKNALLFVLIDSEVSHLEASSKLAKDVEKIGASAILVGGSSATDQIEMSQVVKSIKKGIKIPIILFPGNVTGVVPDADAILFSSLMNSENPYFISQAQALGAPSVLKFGLEPLPTAYLVIGEGTSAWFVGSARGIPFEKPKIAAAYALAAQFLGMRFVYLEAGSGAKSSVTPEMVQTVRRTFNGFLIVGGGIKDVKTAQSLVKAGSDALVIGTFLEKGGSIKKLQEITKAIQRSK
ncbi:geranylgeranylglyceryl/heptaprenylglyceryl phosphate synthase [Marine Group I thaumarchaeote]|jgi:phosphoglycerol geranylgeranyltransferase|uniref:Geranylgeranylglyceryl phosphate synthase n=1 Tax=Marine Group I thaumarchaeote TaxID=2511932 RepID=A0A7K4N4D8_9ARCH|nr:MAG: geranylgeranylglyceryl/heptaprenylglyceryl phosphate synthase [Nitrosopumilus sp. YT1]KPU81080.1 geranylgeranylglyceryl phosphate synthase [Nitrosopumilus sp. PRT-SC01]NMI82377.1 geranylgeranylglyceryl/heptaprenylglyceryl phosphate synthase [Candidatus Nitrosopumilus sp. MTA1]NWJ56497.1 geranylgeranylglyceryl/heptaprenylglyceryl phosphate synthase [Marine Group I thaumarchaeote]NWJ83236.1 geranylgeranylglyceryl/heptaprenylglyceryl phosphate synthase [Marine Group I thaumarchaeote]